MADIEPNEAAFDALLHDVAVVVLDDLAGDVAELARAMAPVRVRHTGIPAWAHHGYVGTPGHLKASVVAWEGEDSDGPYANIGSLWYGRFLDPRARQLTRLYPFLPTALKTGVDGRTYEF